MSAKIFATIDLTYLFSARTPISPVHPLTVEIAPSLDFPNTFARSEEVSSITWFQLKAAFPLSLSTPAVIAFEWGPIDCTSRQCTDRLALKTQARRPTEYVAKVIEVGKHRPTAQAQQRCSVQTIN